MRHAFEPLQGHFMGYGDGRATIFWILLVIAVIALIAILTERSRKKSRPEHGRLMSLLKEKYAKHEIDADECRERSMVLEDEYWIDAVDPEMMRLKERYARCEIDSREYVKRREELGQTRDKSSSASLNERPIQ